MSSWLALAFDGTIREEAVMNPVNSLGSFFNGFSRESSSYCRIKWSCLSRASGYPKGPRREFDSHFKHWNVCMYTPLCTVVKLVKDYVFCQSWCRTFDWNESKGFWMLNQASNSVLERWFEEWYFIIFHSEFQKVFRASATSFSQGHFYV